MQRPSNPVYSYDALGRLRTFTPSGGSSDIGNTYPPTVPVNATIVEPTVTTPIKEHSTILNSPNLFTPVLSRDHPLIIREKTLASSIGYANVPTYALNLDQPLKSLKKDSPIYSTWDVRGRSPYR